MPTVFAQQNAFDFLYFFLVVCLLHLILFDELFAHTWKCKWFFFAVSFFTDANCQSSVWFYLCDNDAQFARIEWHFMMNGHTHSHSLTLYFWMFLEQFAFEIDFCCSSSSARARRSTLKRTINISEWRYIEWNWLLLVFIDGQLRARCVIRDRHRVLICIDGYFCRQHTRTRERDIEKKTMTLAQGEPERAQRSVPYCVEINLRQQKKHANIGVTQRFSYFDKNENVFTQFIWCYGPPIRHEHNDSRRRTEEGHVDGKPTGFLSNDIVDIAHILRSHQKTQFSSHRYNSSTLEWINRDALAFDETNPIGHNHSDALFQQ